MTTLCRSLIASSVLLPSPLTKLYNCTQYPLILTCSPLMATHPPLLLPVLTHDPSLLALSSQGDFPSLLQSALFNPSTLSHSQSAQLFTPLSSILPGRQATRGTSLPCLTAAISLDEESQGSGGEVGGLQSRISLH